MAFLPNTLSLHLYNTESRSKELFRPIQEGKVKMYTCGPTVYAYVHIGNWRTFVFEDLLRRTLELFGYQVHHVMNLTDVDDKTIKGAIAQGVTLDKYTQPYKEAFFSELQALNLLAAREYPCATQFVPEMIEMVNILLEKKVAYKGSDGSVYFNISQFPRYGCLSHLKLDELQAGSSARIAVDEYDKEHASDFVLWKHYDPQRDGTIFWESPFGKGRPGWHLECSTMAIKLLGETIDIHVGGIDNMFPHHENEIAQSEAYSGEPFVKLWMHSEHLVVEGKKMAKSLNNFYTLNDLLAKGYSAKEVRYILLQTHYKTQLNFTFAGLEAARSSLQRLNDFVNRIEKIAHAKDGLSAEEEKKTKSFIQDAFTHFCQPLADDLNISAALAALFDFIRQINLLCDEKQIGGGSAQLILDFMRQVNTILAVIDFDTELTAPAHLQLLLEQRQEARKHKNWQEADRLRALLLAEGYVIEDSPQGPRLKRERK